MVAERMLASEGAARLRNVNSLRDELREAMIHDNDIAKKEPGHCIMHEIIMNIKNEPLEALIKSPINAKKHIANKRY